MACTESGWQSLDLRKRHWCQDETPGVCRQNVIENVADGALLQAVLRVDANAGLQIVQERTGRGPTVGRAGITLESGTGPFWSAKVIVELGN